MLRRPLAALLCAALLLSGCSAAERTGSQGQDEDAGETEAAEPDEATESRAVKLELYVEPDPEPGETQDKQAAPEPLLQDDAAVESAQAAPSDAPPEPGPPAEPSEFLLLSVEGTLEAGEYRLIAEGLTLYVGDRLRCEVTVSGHSRVELGFLAAGDDPQTANKRYYMMQRDVDGEEVSLAYLRDGYSEIMDFAGTTMPESYVFYVWNTGASPLELAGAMVVERAA